MRLNENNDLFPDKNQNQNENTRADVLDQSVHRIKHTGMYRHTVNIPTRVGVGNKYINEIRVVQWVYIYTGAGRPRRQTIPWLGQLTKTSGVR